MVSSLVRCWISSLSTWATRPSCGGPKRVGAAVLLHLVALPGGALGEDDEHVVAGVLALLVQQQRDQLVEVDLVLGDDAAVRGDVRGVERGEAGVAPEDAEDADALVRADGGALAIDGGGGAGDGRGEADAVLGGPHVVVHRLGNADDLHAAATELGGRLEGAVAADGDERVDLQPLEVLEHLVGEVEREAALAHVAGQVFALEVLGQRASPSRARRGSSAGSCRRCGRWCACCPG